MYYSATPKRDKKDTTWSRKIDLSSEPKRATPIITPLPPSGVKVKRDGCCIVL